MALASQAEGFYILDAGVCEEFCSLPPSLTIPTIISYPESKLSFMLIQKFQKDRQSEKP